MTTVASTRELATARSRLRDARRIVRGLAGRETSENRAWKLNQALEAIDSALRKLEVSP